MEFGFPLINEFLPNPEGSDDGEFIEVFNLNDFSIDLSGFYIDDEDGGSKPFQISDEIISTQKETISIQDKTISTQEKTIDDLEHTIKEKDAEIKRIKAEKPKFTKEQAQKLIKDKLKEVTDHINKLMGKV